MHLNFPVCFLRKCFLNWFFYATQYSGNLNREPHNFFALLTEWSKGVCCVSVTDALVGCRWQTLECVLYGCEFF